MSNTARKARKRANIPFQKAPKIGTPVEQRASFEHLAPQRVERELIIRGQTAEAAAGAAKYVKEARAARAVFRRTRGR